MRAAFPGHGSVALVRGESRGFAMVQELGQAHPDVIARYGVALILAGPVHDHEARRLQLSKCAGRFRRGTLEVLRDLTRRAISGQEEAGHQQAPWIPECSEGAREPGKLGRRATGTLLQNPLQHPAQADPGRVLRRLRQVVRSQACLACGGALAPMGGDRRLPRGAQTVAPQDREGPPRASADVSLEARWPPPAAASPRSRPRSRRGTRSRASPGRGKCGWRPSRGSSRVRAQPPRC
jgi:hypothetical protein